ncbi:hypothetical protein Tco_0299836 [Tanacetum coccineum]
MDQHKVLFRRNVPSYNICCLGSLPGDSHCISPGYTHYISLILVLPLGAVLLEVAWSPALKANDGIGIFPLGSWVVVVTVVVVIVVAVVVVIVIAGLFVCLHCRTGVLLSLAGGSFLQFCAFIVYKDVMCLQYTLGILGLVLSYGFLVTVPGSIGPVTVVLPFVWLLVLVISRSVFKLPLVFVLSLSHSGNILSLWAMPVPGNVGCRATHRSTMARAVPIYEYKWQTSLDSPSMQLLLRKTRFPSLSNPTVALLLSGSFLLNGSEVWLSSPFLGRSHAANTNWTPSSIMAEVGHCVDPKYSGGSRVCD